MRSSDRLRALADAMSETQVWDPGPFESVGFTTVAVGLHMSETRGRAQNVYRWAADAAEELRRHSSELDSDYVNKPRADALLARLDGLLPDGGE